MLSKDILGIEKEDTYNTLTPICYILRTLYQIHNLHRVRHGVTSIRNT